MNESALPGFEVNSWYGVCAPSGTPAAILGKLNADLTAVLRNPEIEGRFREMLITAAPTSPEEFGKFMRAETQRWAKVIKAAGIPRQ